MSAILALLHRAQAGGLTIQAAGSKLRLSGTKPPADLLAELIAAKPELLAHLTSRAATDVPAYMAPLPSREPPPAPTYTEADVEALARALAAKPGQRMMNEERAMQYFRGEALRRIRIGQV